jgi:hypothetical protein
MGVSISAVTSVLITAVVAFIARDDCPFPLEALLQTLDQICLLMRPASPQPKLVYTDQLPGR